MPAPKKVALATSLNDEQDTKKEESSTPTPAQEEPSGEKLPVVQSVQLLFPTEVLNLSSRQGLSQTQGIWMWQDQLGIRVVSQDERVKGVCLIPWGNIKAVRFA